MKYFLLNLHALKAGGYELVKARRRDAEIVGQKGRGKLISRQNIKGRRKTVTSLIASPATVLTERDRRRAAGET